MLSYNGTDYTLVVITVLAVVLLVAAEYFICAKAKRNFVKYILFVVPAAFLAVIPFTLTGSSGGFVDLRPLAAFIEFIAAAICAAAIGAGWLICKIKKK